MDGAKFDDDGGNSAIPDHVFNENGELDYDALLEAVQHDPQLLAQLQRLYSEAQTTEFDLIDHTLASVYEYCVVPSIQSIIDTMFWLLVACIFCNLVGRLVERMPRFVHLLISLTGMLLLWKFFAWNIMILAIYTLVSGFMLLVKFSRLGMMMSSFTVIYVVLCEIFLNPEHWHNVRGAQIVLSMKAISLAFDTDKEDVDPVSIVEYSSYMLNPGTVIFGPWLSFNDYLNGIFYRKKWFDSRLLLTAGWFSALSISTLLYSGCFITYFFSDQTENKWMAAYRDAQSFRFSHYFVCFTSQLTALLAGLSKYHPTGYLTEPITVTKPYNIELPRSLVEVVVSWNLPMHSWLKKYVFKITQPLYGNLSAVLITYIASSLLHGLNFQLAAALLSLGFYSYIEHTLRKHLASTLTACIEARACKTECSHHYKSHSIYTRSLNILFGLLSMFHLAYIGLVFDTSDQKAHSEGYSMTHTLSKWANLGFSSHLIAFSTYCFYILIKP